MLEFKIDLKKNGKWQKKQDEVNQGYNGNNMFWDNLH